MKLRKGCMEAASAEKRRYRGMQTIFAQASFVKHAGWISSKLEFWNFQVF